MINITIRYDPINIETEIRIEGKKVKENSELNISKGTLIEDWIQNIPHILKEECNTDRFEVLFEGTREDYRKLILSVDNFKEKTHIKCEYKEILGTKQLNKEIKKTNLKEHYTLKNIFIKYNPYELKTEVTVDEKPVKENSKLNIEDDKRLQEWIEDLPKILKDECNTDNFKLLFHGTTLDYEDICLVARQAKEEGINIECSHKPAIETVDKEYEIKKLFGEIQDGPFEDLKTENLRRVFNKAFDSDFEVNVIATMSAGKSTLINAMLQKKLMPAKNEACTAIITKIKESSTEDYNAIVFNKNGERIESYEKMDLEIMNRLNSNKDVSTISIEGKIPFVKKGDLSLILVDTPGPNNSRDPEHKVTTYKMIEESSKTLILYIMNATQLGVDDDNNLLDYISEQMRVGGKQSKDRFMFVINKLDDFNTKDGDSVVSAIEKVKKYLKEKGIENPNIYPIAALPALNLRLLKTQKDTLDEDTIDEIEYKLKKMNRNEELHLERYASLTPSLKNEVSNLLASDDKNKEALIHTGIVSLELAISTYTQKYGKSAKIKNITDILRRKLKGKKLDEDIKKEIVSVKEEIEGLNEQIKAIKNKIKDGEESKNLKEEIEKTNYIKDIEIATKEMQKKFQGEMRIKFNEIGKNSKDRLKRNEAESFISNLKNSAIDYQAKIKIDLERIVDIGLRRNVEALLEKYKNKMKSLQNDIQLGEIVIGIKLDELIQGEIENMDQSDIIKNSVKKEQVTTQKKVRNENKKWYKPWTWLDDKFITEYVNEEVEYISKNEITDQMISKIDENMYTNIIEVIRHSKIEIDEIKKKFNESLNEVDNIIINKMNEYENLSSEKGNEENRLKEIESNLIWIENINTKVNTILEI